MIYDYDPGDAPQIVMLRQGGGVSRRGRKCSCGKRIPPGTAYRETAGTEDGAFFYDIRCAGACPAVKPMTCARCQGRGHDPDHGYYDGADEDLFFPDLCHDCGGTGVYRD